MSRLSRHLRANAVAYLALFVALGGTSYAAINVPAGSVGNRQLKNHSITPLKLDPNRIAGSVRHWVHVSATGRILASSGPVHVSASAGAYQVTWKDAYWGDRYASRCMPVVTVDTFNGQVPPPGNQAATFAQASVFRDHARATTTVVVTTGNTKATLASSFYLALVCG